MDNAQVAVAGYRPDWWPASTTLLIRRVLLIPEQVSADPAVPAAPHPAPGQRALPIPELAEAGAIHGCSFILISLDVSAPGKAAAAEHWYRHRSTVAGAALRHLPSSYPQDHAVWMQGALIAASMAAWLHQLTTATRGETVLDGHGVRGGKAMIATLRRPLIAVPGSTPRPLIR
jgi:hypothetical protein